MVKAVLFDIEGTLTYDGVSLPGAAAAVGAARQAGMKIRFLTNIASRSPAMIAEALRRQGVEAAADEVATAVTACASRLASMPGARAHLIVPDSVRPLFAGIQQDAEAPDVVVVGDVADDFTFATMNRAYRMIERGAEFLALSRSMYWVNGGVRQLDAGPFVVALEAATGRQATVCGKPAPAFFQAALDHLGVAAHEALLIGDDVTSDIVGACSVGIPCCLVGTGKYRPEDHAVAADAGAAFLPDLTAFATLPAIAAVRGETTS